MENKVTIVQEKLDVEWYIIFDHLQAIQNWQIIKTDKKIKELTEELIKRVNEKLTTETERKMKYNDQLITTYVIKEFAIIK